MRVHRTAMGVFGRRRAPVAAVEQLSSHPEVNQENPTAFEPNNQILAAATDCCDPLPLELGGHFGGVLRPGEARVEDLDVLESATDELRLETCPDGLDLGKLRHRCQRSVVQAADGLAQAMTSITTDDSVGGSSAST
jgi:hypothetical protein